MSSFTFILTICTIPSKETVVSGVLIRSSSFNFPQSYWILPTVWSLSLSSTAAAEWIHIKAKSCWVSRLNHSLGWSDRKLQSYSPPLGWTPPIHCKTRVSLWYLSKRHKLSNGDISLCTFWNSISSRDGLLWPSRASETDQYGVSARGCVLGLH